MTQTTRERLEIALRTAIQKQFPEVYFWDPADEGLFAEGEREWSEFDGGVKLADRFDLGAAVDAILAELRTPDEGMAREVGDGCPSDRGDYNFGYDGNPEYWRESCRSAARAINTAMIDHVRGGEMSGDPCNHLKTQGREGEAGSWCMDCGVKVWAVHDRPCGECRHFKLDLGARVMGICGPNLMAVTSCMFVSYAIEPTPDRSGLCFASIDHP